MVLVGSREMSASGHGCSFLGWVEAWCRWAHLRGTFVGGRL